MFVATATLGEELSNAPQTETDIYEKKVRNALKKLLEYVVKPTEGRKREFRCRIEQAAQTPHGYHAVPGDLTQLTSDEFLGRITDNDVPTWRHFLEGIRESPLYMDFLYISPLAEAA